MANKDPAFLFYSEKWLQGTASMMPEEKGIYIDLLAHQHQDGSLPTNTKRLAKMVGLSETDFLPIWEAVKVKFGLSSDNRLVNQKLTEVVTKRSTNGLTYKINGTLAAVIKKLGFDAEVNSEVKKFFKTTDFEPFATNGLTERLTDWYVEKAEAFININRTISKGDKEGVQGKKKGDGDFPLPTAKVVNGLPKQKSEDVKLRVRLMQGVMISDEDIAGMWEVFKNTNLTGKKFYQTIDDIYNHFSNWMKDQKFSKYGQRNSSSVGRTFEPD